jgi:hypothetical protein
MSKETMHNVTIDVVDRTFDKDMNTVDETREGVFEGRLGGTTKLVSVLKAYEKVRTKDGVKGNLNNLEVGVDNCPFC